MTSSTRAPDADAHPALTNLTTSAAAPAPAPAPLPVQTLAPSSTPPQETTVLAPCSSLLQSWHASTLAIHADDHLRRVPDIAPPIHLSTTFHYAKDPADLFTVKEVRARQLQGHHHQQQQQQQQQPQHNNNNSDLTDISAQGPPPEPVEHIYSRETTHNTTRLETILQPLLHGDSVVYSSGLAALHAVYMLLKPRRVAISGGYHGAHAVLALHRRLTGLETFSLEDGPSHLSAGDVFHVETPVNPTGEARDLGYFAAAARKAGAYLVVDATFGPPPLQDPFAYGADIVMHSGTKYMGGHSDLLCGVLATRNKAWARQLRDDRTVVGSVMGGLEAWLVIRSLRTLEVRVARASENVGLLVGWLEGERKRGEGSAVGSVVEKVLHASVQAEELGRNETGNGNGNGNRKGEGNWLRKQMPNGFGPVFAIVMKERELARRLPSHLRVFQHATSLGGVESLIEWRAMSDDSVDERLLRVSVGIENWADLREDLRMGMEGLAKERQ